MTKSYFLFDPLLQLADQFDRVLSGYPEGTAFPPVSLAESADEVVVQAMLPGMKKEEIRLNVDKGRLSISGKREFPSTEGARLLRNELAGGEFERWIRLPERVDAASAEARYEDGVLTLRFRKAEDAKPKQITIS